MSLVEAIAVIVVVGGASIACGRSGNGSPREAHAPAVTLVPDYSATMNPLRTRGEIFTSTPTPVATVQPVPALVAATPLPCEVSFSR